MDVLGQEWREAFGRRANSRFTLILMLVVSTLLLLSSLYSAEASVFKKARESVLDAAAPVLAFFAGPVAFIEDRVGQVRDYFNVLDQNEALRKENAELRRWMEEAIRLREDLAGYERLQAYATELQSAPIDAFVIGDSNDAFARAMIVNAGAGKGVRKDMAVVDDRGLVGRIIEVGNRASRILLLTDAASRIPVFVENTSLRGLLIGRSGKSPVVSFEAGAVIDELSAGQRVLTSGAGGALPRGIGVGRIAAIDPSGDAVVDLDVNYARTRIVRVINYQFPEFEPAPAEALAPPEQLGGAPPPVAIQVREAPRTVTNTGLAIDSPEPPPPPRATEDEE